MSLRTNAIRSSLCALKIQRAGGNLEFVRFRKPRFEPKAPSKIFRVREPTPIDPEEYELMKTWTRRYQTQMKSLRSYLCSYSEKIEKYEAIQSPALSYEDELITMNDKNAAFNQHSSNLREPAIDEMERQKQLLQEKMIERDLIEKQEMRRKAEERVEQEKAKFPEYTLPTNLEESIERLLNSRVDHNYPITRRGQLLKKNTTVTSSEENNSESSENTDGLIK